MGCRIKEIDLITSKKYITTDDTTRKDVFNCKQITDLRIYCSSDEIRNTVLKDYIDDINKKKISNIEPSKLKELITTGGGTLSEYNIIDKELIELARNPNCTFKKDRIKKISNVIKYIMCYISTDKLIDEKFDDKDDDNDKESNWLSSTNYEWWDNNIFGYDNIFQLNLYILSLLICLYFKYKILNTSSQYLGTICLILTLFLLFILINKCTTNKEKTNDKEYKIRNVLINIYINILKSITPAVIIIAICIRLYKIKKYLSSKAEIIIIIMFIMFIILTFRLNILTSDNVSSIYYNFIIGLFLTLTFSYIMFKRTNIIAFYPVILYILLLAISVYFLSLIHI